MAKTIHEQKYQAIIEKEKKNIHNILTKHCCTMQFDEGYELRIDGEMLDPLLDELAKYFIPDEKPLI